MTVSIRDLAARAARSLTAAAVLVDALGGAESVSPPCVHERRALRQLAGASNTTMPVWVVAGSAAPAEHGESFHWTTPGGAPVRNPNAYRRAWGKPVYHASSIRVEVGVEWLVSWRCRGGQVETLDIADEAA